MDWLPISSRLCPNWKASCKRKIVIFQVALSMIGGLVADLFEAATELEKKL